MSCARAPPSSGKHGTSWPAIVTADARSGHCTMGQAHAHASRRRVPPNPRPKLRTHRGSARRGLVHITMLQSPSDNHRCSLQVPLFNKDYCLRATQPRQRCRQLSARLSTMSRQDDISQTGKRRGPALRSDVLGRGACVRDSDLEMANPCSRIRSWYQSHGHRIHKRRVRSI